MKTTSISLLIALFCTQLAWGSMEDTTSKVKRPFQMTLVSPLGTNGLEAHKITNNVSFNILAGYNGGVDGVEIGGFANISDGKVRGVQFAGFGNLVNDEVEGSQFAGFYNINRGYTNGAQFAGFVNVVGDSAQAMQFAGFTNVTHGSQIGLQAAGFANHINGDLKGSQLAGFINTAKNVEGAQVAGFINLAKNVKGAQIGFINICDSLEDGVAVGFLSIIKSGYRTFELGGNETLWGHAAFKIGSKRFYNIFAAGAKVEDNVYHWGIGYGVGTRIDVSSRLKLSVDGLAYQMSKDEAWSNGLNLLNRANVAAEFLLSEKVSIFAGPSYNVLVSREKAAEGGYTYSDIAPYSFYDKINRNNVKTTMWIGFNAGLRF